MEILIRLECDACGKSFIVYDDDVAGDFVTCPHCGADVDVPEPADE